MPVLFAVLGTAVVFGMFLLGHGLYALPLVAVVAVLFPPGSYLFAWFGVLLTCATAVKYGPLAACDLFLVPALITAAFWLMQQPRAKRPKIPAVLLLFGLGLMVITGLEYMVGWVTGLEVAYALRLVMIIVGMPVLFMVHGRTTKRFEGLLGAFVLSASLNGIFAELDAIGVHIASRLTGREGFVHSERYAGLSSHTTQLGMISVLAVPMLVYLGRKNKAWYIAAFPMLIGVLASGSRGALLGVPIALVVLAICEGRHRVRMIVSIGVLGIIALLAANALGLTVGVSRLLGTKSVSQSDTFRLDRASTAIAQIAQRPLLGQGFGVPAAHDAYLEILRDGGFVVGLPIFALWIWGYVRAYRTRNPLGYAMAASLATWIILNAQFNGLYERYLWMPFGAAVGIAALISSGTLDLDAYAPAARRSRYHSPRPAQPTRPTVAVARRPAITTTRRVRFEAGT